MFLRRPRSRQSRRTAAGDLEHRSVAQLQSLLAEASPDALASAVDAMATIRSTFKDSGETRSLPPSSSPHVTLRDLRPGDLGWVVSRHGALYAAEYSWEVSFEALVGRIVADFATSHDPTRERAWIANLDGVPVGCIFCVRAESGDPDTAQLRLLLVEPTDRGHGVASALVHACHAFARASGYTRIVLWTNDVLAAARRIYEREGFTLISQESHTSFGHELVGQHWGREL